MSTLKVNSQKFQYFKRFQLKTAVKNKNASILRTPSKKLEAIKIHKLLGKGKNRVRIQQWKTFGVKTVNTLNQSKIDLSTRNIKLDVLRFIGLLSIILAHSNPPTVLFQLRNFDVPLMVIVSGAAFGISSVKNKLSYRNYLHKRVIRLLFPTWLFLSFFFILTWALSLISGHCYPFSKETILLSYTLISGIGYVWIIRVFLLVASIAPFVINISNRIKDDLEYFMILIIFYIIYEVIYIKYTSTNYIIDIFMQNVLYYIIPYGCLFGIGLRLPSLSRKSIVNIILINFALFFILLLINYGLDLPILTQEYKYPPRIYYISYSILISFFLYILLDEKVLKVCNNKVIFFISSFSMWIYLWHILFIYFWKWSVNLRPDWTNSYIITFLVIIFLSSSTTYIQRFPRM